MKNIHRSYEYYIKDFNVYFSLVMYQINTLAKLYYMHEVFVFS